MVTMFSHRLARVCGPLLAAAALAIFMTWPLARDLGSVGRTGVRGGDARFGTNADGMFSLWNVSWVARTLFENPRNLFNANIFYPDKNSLAFSEPNLVAGAIGAPVWMLTRNPYATLNFVILVAFAAAWFFAWLLVRYLTGSSEAGVVAGVLFAFCPYVFAHTSHIQLMLTAGIPAAMLALHRLADEPSMRRGIVLGLAILVQGLACAYYGIFTALLVGYAVLFLSMSRRLWRSGMWWMALASAAAVACAGTLPFFAHFTGIRTEGFGRTLGESAAFSANASSYLASSAYAHAWLLRLIASWPAWREVMFPGFMTLGLSIAGGCFAIAGARASAARRERETALLYGTAGLLACWASFGPAGRLYPLLFELPIFTFLRAPSRFAIVVVLALAVVGSLATRRLLAAAGNRRHWAAAALTLVAIAELATAMPWERAVQLPLPYRSLAQMPPAPIAEFPFYSRRPYMHAQYMLYSTSHWMPLLNGYSDHLPARFREDALNLESFPSDRSFATLQGLGVRYVSVHWDRYGARAADVRQRLLTYKRYLQPIALSDRTEIYEIIAFP
jgi:hypothetical protein